MNGIFESEWNASKFKSPLRSEKVSVIMSNNPKIRIGSSRFLRAHNSQSSLKKISKWDFLYQIATSSSRGMKKIFTTYYFDKFGNKKHEQEKKKELYNKLEQHNVDTDVMHLREHQEQLGLTSLLQLNYLKQSKKRQGQVEYFTVGKKEIATSKVRLADLINLQEKEKLTKTRFRTYISMMDLKRDVAISSIYCSSRCFKNSPTPNAE